MSFTIVLLASLVIGQGFSDEAETASKPSKLDFIHSSYYTPRAGDEAVLWANVWKEDRYGDVLGTWSDRAFDNFFRKIKEKKPLYSKIPELRKAMESGKPLGLSALNMRDDYDGLITIKGGTKARVLEAPTVPYGEAEFSLARTKVLIMDGNQRGQVAFVPMASVVHMIRNPAKGQFFRSEVKRLEGTKIPALRSRQWTYKPKIGDEAAVYAWLPERGPLPIHGYASRADYAEYFIAIDRCDQASLDRLAAIDGFTKIESGTRVKVLDFPVPIAGIEEPPAHVEVLDGPDAGEEFYVVRIAVMRFADAKPSKP